MSRKAPGSDPNSLPRYIACLDIAVVVCVLVVAGRPDGMAITVTAVILSVFALIYRRVLSVKAELAAKARQQAARKEAAERAARKAQEAASNALAAVGAKEKSWLRGDG